MLVTLLVLLASLLVLSKSSDWLVKSSCEIADFLRINEFAVGLLLVAVATSLPELAVSVLAALRGETEIAVGNVFGSNVANLGLVLGAALFFGFIAVRKSEARILIGSLFIASLLPLLMFSDATNRFLGVLLLLSFGAFVFVVSKEKISGGSVAPEGRSFAASVVFFVASLALLFGSAHFAVDSAVRLAFLAGISKEFIAATLIAVGTSVPELSTTIAAVRMRKASLALGNVLGSCVTNLTLVLGASALFAPLETTNVFAFMDLIIFALLMNFLAWFFINSRKKLGSREGIVLIAAYALFLASLVFEEALF